jgi:hypothetical protein
MTLFFVVSLILERLRKFTHSWYISSLKCSFSCALSKSRMALSILWKSNKTHYAEKPPANQHQRDEISALKGVGQWEYLQHNTMPTLKTGKCCLQEGSCSQKYNVIGTKLVRKPVVPFTQNWNCKTNVIFSNKY